MTKDNYKLTDDEYDAYDFYSVSYHTLDSVVLGLKRMPNSVNILKQMVGEYEALIDGINNVYAKNPLMHQEMELGLLKVRRNGLLEVIAELESDHDS